MIVTDKYIVQTMMKFAMTIMHAKRPMYRTVGILMTIVIPNATEVVAEVVNILRKLLENAREKALAEIVTGARATG